jgi:ABC-type transport system involved in multi-copper enzyme maturation permease subunit
MVRDFDIPPYLVWLPDAVLHYLLVVGLLAVAGLCFAFFIAAVRHGPMRAGDMIYRVMASVASDLWNFSPRRVFALARLAVQESMRRKVWVALVIFGVVLLFAGWFLNPSSDPHKLSSFDPGKLYINFVLTATTYLVMLLAIFLSAMSLPTDIKNRTIFTIVTKPVRTGEIVLGRILGFAAIGTVLLFIMGAASYVFVNRTLDHTHELTAADLTDLPPDPGAISSGGKEGFTSIDHNHRHHVVLDANGNGVTDVQQGHYHHVHGEKGADGQMHYTVGPPEDQLVARVPIYGKLRILDRSGKEGEGINIGKEWTYRKYLDGGTPMAAIWTFTDITPERFPDGKLPLEMLLRVFRTYKGKIADESKNNRTVGILSSLELVNPERPSMKSEAIIFTAKDQVIDKHTIPRKLERNTENGVETIDLFDDLVTKEDGQHRLELHLRCLEPSQYVGVAEADVYLKSSNGSYPLNFVKGYFGIWMQMVLVVGFGVMLSTFLSGPVAILATLGTLIMGFFTKDVVDLFRAVIEHNYKLVPGGGPVESLIRLIAQHNITSELEPSLGVHLAQFSDKILMSFMWAIVQVLPNFNDYSNVQFVADGFDVPMARILQQATLGMGFLLALFVAGHIFLRMREVAK